MDMEGPRVLLYSFQRNSLLFLPSLLPSSPLYLELHLHPLRGQGPANDLVFFLRRAVDVVPCAVPRDTRVAREGRREEEREGGRKTLVTTQGVYPPRREGGREGGRE